LRLLLAFLSLCGALAAADQVWLRPQAPGDPLVWGRKDGLVFGLPSPGGLPGPRGLIRVGIFAKDHSRPELVNFIAIEPVISGPDPRRARMAFSELEPSQLDPGKRGKRLTLKAGPRLLRSRGIEQLQVPIAVERFSANGAHVFVVASMFSDQPNELHLSVAAYPDSAPIEELTLTATMGNFERLRVLWLKDRLLRSDRLFAGYREDNFIEHENYMLDEMLRTAGGDAIALATSNEASPANVFSPTAAPHWHYQLPRLTQYWKVPASYIEPDLRVRVNGRRVYWASHDPIPGGPAFENFEVRQRYRLSQIFIFGLTTEEPRQFQPPIPHLPKEQ
jgi:hypothetical protein